MWKRHTRTCKHMKLHLHIHVHVYTTKTNNVDVLTEMKYMIVHTAEGTMYIHPCVPRTNSSILSCTSPRPARKAECWMQTSTRSIAALIALVLITSGMTSGVLT